MNDEYLRTNADNLLEVVPETSRDKQLEFIDTYRQLQAENNARAAASAHALGSDLTAPYGGLHGPSDYMKSRYQAPQTESRIASLRTAAQLSALNQVMNNELAKWEQRYRDAYNRAQNKPSTTSPTNNNGDVVYDTIEQGTLEPGLKQVYDPSTGKLTNTTVVAPEGVDESGNPRYITIDNATNTVVDSADGLKSTSYEKQAAADAWAKRAGYGSWAGYVAAFTDENGNVNFPPGKPSSIEQFNVERFSLGY